MRERIATIASYIDLTSLNNSDTVATIETLSDNASFDGIEVAALCVFPELIVAAKQALQQRGLSLPVATVTNFPEGHDNVARAVAETERAVAVGADEVDVVLPYNALIAGDEAVVTELVSAVKAACGQQAHLKVIIESGELKTPERIKRASELAIDAGADFIKTSTGKVPVNATLEATAVMLNAIKASGRNVGFKAAGGIRTLADAEQYINLAADIMGKDWVTPEHFRIGASSLVNDLKQQLG
ncbi:deoxyribose-phosphate aldolase [Idiomarina sp. OT37-5b]|jgi:deoxyribose-phosphate aldolase|uniref:Deoxyribose-phosphate aldolase n=1 Tax=Idiomarina aquatica TaxID=1327752 RepID=A0AA94ECU7_9GAMM|nr:MULTISPECIES: deoxyribose-phosphate aldolase [Idiomarina]AVJ56479.1 deoxyribose-phosphate aldolase [Idiomarina sp. OT37-5b]RUO40008.1 deoxyribose-phosphate aldolase [Idiomarina aquatica]